MIWHSGLSQLYVVMGLLYKCTKKLLSLLQQLHSIAKCWVLLQTLENNKRAIIMILFLRFDDYHSIRYTSSLLQQLYSKFCTRAYFVIVKGYRMNFRLCLVLVEIFSTWVV